jgi:hypothetical protein
MSHRLFALLAGGVFLVASNVAASAYSVVTPAEVGVLSMTAQWTYMAQSSSRPGARGGFVYLGNGRASVAYQVNVPSGGPYVLWIRFDDDGLHPANARGVEIWVNGVQQSAYLNPSVQTNGWINIRVGTLNLQAGTNSIIFTKIGQTSAAFVMDEFVVSSDPGYVPG